LLRFLTTPEWCILMTLSLVKYIMYLRHVLSFIAAINTYNAAVVDAVFVTV